MPGPLVGTEDMGWEACVLDLVQGWSSTALAVVFLLCSKRKRVTVPTQGGAALCTHPVCKAVGHPQLLLGPSSQPGRELWCLWGHL